MKKVGVIGAGKWGSAIAGAFSENHNTVITSRTKREMKNFVSLEEVLEREYIVVSIASQSIREFLKQVDLKDKKILVASKGIDRRDHLFLNEIYEQKLPAENICYLGGPSFAKEVADKKPTALVIAAYDQGLAEVFGSFFPRYIKTYVDDDVIGVEVAGAYKNVVAMASGICEGLNLGSNAKASLLARGLVEMERFGARFGAKKETFLGLAGAGDLFLTANSTLSRNYRVGLGIAEGKTLETILEELGEVAEGVFTTEAICSLSKKEGIYTPIADEVLAVLNGKEPRVSLRDLLK